MHRECVRAFREIDSRLLHVPRIERAVLAKPGLYGDLASGVEVEVGLQRFVVLELEIKSRVAQGMEQQADAGQALLAIHHLGAQISTSNPDHQRARKVIGMRAAVGAERVLPEVLPLVLRPRIAALVLRNQELILRTDFPRRRQKRVFECHLEPFILDFARRKGARGATTCGQHRLDESI
ncbi:hypothetical protein D9M72_562730 [compost metagenome]